MKMIVRRTALAVCTLVLALILPTAASAACAGFDDVPETADCYESVMYLAEHKITQGTGNGCFSPDAPVTTSQWSVMLCRAYGVETNGSTWSELRQNAVEQSYWQSSTVLYVLRNEKYVGDSLSRKKYTTQYIPWQQKLNHGKYDQVLVKDSHPPIISREVFSKTQKLLKRKNAGIQSDAQIEKAFTRKVTCGNCGSLCKLKNCKSISYWVCRKHDKSAAACPNTQVPEEQLKSAFLRLYYKLKHYGADILTQFISDLYAARTGSLLWSENIVEINKQISDIASQERLLTQLKQQGSVDPDIFISRGNLLAERRRELKLQKERILRSEEDHTIQQTQDMLDVLESGPDWLDAFDEQLFSDLVEKIEVVDNEKLCFRLLNGLEVTEKIERTQR